MRSARRLRAALPMRMVCTLVASKSMHSFLRRAVEGAVGNAAQRGAPA